MPITLADIQSYWASNPTLLDQIPAASVYVEIIPERTQLPFAVLSGYASNPDYTTATAYIENVSFTVTVWNNSLANAQAMAKEIDTQFAGASPATGTVGCWREGYKVMAEEHTGPNLYGYGVAQNYLLMVQQALSPA